jgi:glycerate-2-kinase
VSEQIESDVESAARQLAARAGSLSAGEILIAGGEPTVTVHGRGRGGRCSELAVRFALQRPDLHALFASSDGIDGNSGAAGVVVDSLSGQVDQREAAQALERSDSFSIATSIGRAVIIQPTGNNLRDLYLVARP